MRINELVISLKASDPNEMLEGLQHFFQGITNAGSEDGGNLLASYSTLSVLRANGMNKDSILAVKRAIIARVIALNARWPALMSETRRGLQTLVQFDDDLPMQEKVTVKAQLA